MKRGWLRLACGVVMAIVALAPPGFSAQEHPKGAPEHPKGAPEHPKGAPEHPQEHPKSSQEGLAGPPPPPEVKRLQPFVGRWTGTMTYLGPDGSSETAKLQINNQWVANGFSLMGRETAVGQMRLESVALLGYDRPKNQYVSMGFNPIAQGPIIMYGTYDEAAGTFNFDYAFKMQDGMEIKGRVVTKSADADNYRVDIYVATPEGQQRKVVESVLTRAKGGGKQPKAAPRKKAQ